MSKAPIRFEDITELDVKKFAKVRASGVTNMFDASVVAAKGGLRRERVIAILDNWDALLAKYPDILKD